MKHNIVIGLFVLTSCSTFQKKTLSFVTGETISFFQNEDSIPNNAALIKNVQQFDKDSIFIGSKNMVYYFGDSIDVGADYKLTTCDFPGVRIHQHRIIGTKLNSNYLQGANRTFIDFVILRYYDKELYELEIFAKRLNNIDSLLSVIECFYDSRFSKTHYEWNKDPYDPRYGTAYQGHYGEWTSEFGSFRKNKIYVSYVRDYIFDEVVISIANLKVRPPFYRF